jgi:fatty-acyl-CoA synthase
MGLFASIEREAVFIAAVVRTLKLTHGVEPDARLTVATWVERHAREQATRPAVLHGDRVIDWRALDEGANRYARWARAQGMKKGDVVALLMENRPEYLMAWLGLVKEGIVAALINTHLTSAPLAHSLAISGAKHVILGSELAEAFDAAAAQVPERLIVWATDGRISGAEDVDAALAAQSAEPLENPAEVFCRDNALYIYTSGTTGMPKAAKLSHMRVLHMLSAFQGAVNAGPDDRMYDVLPLYHSAGGICALGPVFLGGASVVVREKFSAHEFWSDCAKYKPTLFQYIGELCRYLLNTPEDPQERAHNLRIAIGNGLRPEIWPKFQERFRIPHIMEFYGATEGNVGMINYDGKVGAIGRVPWYARSIQKIRLIRFDVEKQAPVRGPDGHCQETADDEIGEAIGQINDKVARERFDGYTKTEDTAKKVLRDVFRKGDAWFRTHDLMRRDKHGYFYFVDRTGDTFRWKGENVATSEVAAALSGFPGVKEANVYGVVVPGDEGKAGMAALVTGEGFDLAGLAAHLERHLPSYARPVFLRFQKAIEATSTFKQRKIDLQKEGFDPTKIGDELYVHTSSGRFEKLTPQIYLDIENDRIAL